MYLPFARWFKETLEIIENENFLEKIEDNYNNLFIQQNVKNKDRKSLINHINYMELKLNEHINNLIFFITIQEKIFNY